MDLRHANRLWGTSEGCVRIVDGHSNHEEESLLAVIPLAFTSSLDLRAAYLVFVIRCLVEEQDIILREGSSSVQADSEILATTYSAFSTESR